MFDVVRPEARGTAAGFMNAIGWLAGGGSAPIVIGIIAQRESLGLAIALASTVYVAAGVLLLLGIVFFVKGDSAKMQARTQRVVTTRQTGARQPSRQPAVKAAICCCRLRVRRQGERSRRKAACRQADADAPGRRERRHARR